MIAYKLKFAGLVETLNDHAGRIESLQGTADSLALVSDVNLTNHHIANTFVYAVKGVLSSATLLSTTHISNLLLVSSVLHGANAGNDALLIQSSHMFGTACRACS